MSQRIETSGGTIFTVHSDTSETVTIAAPYLVRPYDTITIPVSDLLQFVAHIVANQRIEHLEQASPEEVLGLPMPKGESK